MNAGDRRAEILSHLSSVRQSTVSDLAQKFDVSKRTIRYDIETLTLTAPIETVQGNGGGIRILDWYRHDRKTLAPEQVSLLKKLAPTLKGQELTVLNSILTQFGQYSR